MDQKEAEEAIARYEELVDRAREIVKGAPYWAYVEEPDYARLYIEGGTATLLWPHDEMDYDMSVITCERKCFETRLLFMSDEELKVWKAEQDRLYHEQQEERAKLVAAQQDEIERQMYERLKARFG